MENVVRGDSESTLAKTNDATADPTDAWRRHDDECRKSKEGWDATRRRATIALSYIVSDWIQSSIKSMEEDLERR